MTRPGTPSSPAPDPQATWPPIVYTFSFESWTDAVDREFYATQDRLAARLLRQEGQVLIANPPRSGAVRLAKLALRRTEASFPDQPGKHLMTPIRAFRRPPRTVRGARQLYRSVSHQMGRAARAHALGTPVVITTSPYVAGFAPMKWASQVIYYAVDDWVEHHAHQSETSALSAAHQEFAVSGRALCAVSQGIVDRIAPKGTSLVVTNGLEPTEWTAAPPPVPPWLARLPRPWILYAGTLDSRLDCAAVSTVADALPTASLVAVGHALEPHHVAPLQRVPNVHLVGPRPRAELIAALRSADCGLVPHHDNALTRCMSPLKLYEYLAAGLPVVATDLPPIRGVAPQVELVPPGGQFALAVQSALSRPRTAEQQRLEFITGNSWARRHEQIWRLATDLQGGPR